VLTTEGALLNGRLHYRQPAHGFRSGIEPVLLAAAIPAEAGHRVLEAGTGAGAALLCLLGRVPGTDGLGVEQDAGMAALATANAEANGLARMRVVNGDILSVPLAELFDHAMANPPYHPPGPISPVPERERAKRDDGGLIRHWTLRLAGALRASGTLTLVLPAGSAPTAIEAMQVAGCGGLVLFPLWPKSGRDAKLVLLRGVRGSRTPFRLSGGLVLHEPDGQFTRAAQAILREGGGLAL
jgi:tRNA1Val (adenine37-N6)-methyltransferase